MCLIDEFTDLIMKHDKGSIGINNFFLYWRHETEDFFDEDLEYVHVRYWISFDPSMDPDKLPKLLCYKWDLLEIYTISLFLEDLCSKVYIRGYIV